LHAFDPATFPLANSIPSHIGVLLVLGRRIFWSVIPGPKLGLGLIPRKLGSLLLVLGTAFTLVPQRSV
jgi:hypothetical protein